MLKASRFLNPKSDVVFKKVFGCHENLLRSFLNAMMPLPKGKIIERLEYLTPEQVPVIPEFKRTIVDVKCFDQDGCHFIVEMQMEWTTSFASRILYGASQAFVQQLKKGSSYQHLAPVYALGLINENFDDSPEFYHHYKLRHAAQSHKTIEGLEIILVELKKFKPSNQNEKRLRALWIRFLNDTENMEDIPDDFKSFPELVEAMELTQESSYSRSELDYYHSYWDSVSSEKTLIGDAYTEGKMEGEAIGIQKGKAEGEAIGVLKGKIETAKKLKSMGLTDDQILAATDLSEGDLKGL